MFNYYMSYQTNILCRRRGWSHKYLHAFCRPELGGQSKGRSCEATGEKCALRGRQRLR